MAAICTHARFHIAQMAHHRLFDHRGVSVAVDPSFLDADTGDIQITRSG